MLHSYPDLQTRKLLNAFFFQLSCKLPLPLKYCEAVVPQGGAGTSSCSVSYTAVISVVCCFLSLSVAECPAAEPQTYLLKLLAPTGSLALQSRQMAEMMLPDP